MNRRGGSLYFVSHGSAHVQLYQYSDQEYSAYYSYDDTMTLTVDGMEISTITKGNSWNGTIPASGAVYIQWGWNLLLPHEVNFIFYIGMAGLIMFIAGLGLAVYSFRHYPFFTLGNEDTVWEKDALMFAVVLLVLGLCLVFAWFFTGT